MTLPTWASPLLTGEQMRAVDRWAIETKGIAGLDLMEWAAEALARVVAEMAPDGRVVVVCGKGNNGGDGLAAARLLRTGAVGGAERDVDVLLTCDSGELKGDAAENLQRLGGAAPAPFAAGTLDGAQCVVDALLGTGATGAPRGLTRDAILAINSFDGTVVAADLPSGVDADTGAVSDVAVEADATVTFHFAKPGLLIAPGMFHAGHTRTVPIGIPSDALAANQIDPDIGVILPSVLELVPDRSITSTKFSEGVVGIVGGSTGLSGAPCLAAEAACRAGAGYVTVYLPESLNIVSEQRLLEAMSKPLPERNGSLSGAGFEIVMQRADRFGACVLGPGLGHDDDARALIRRLASEMTCPIVIDADGLNAFEGRIDDLRGCGSAVLTPHAGEMSRLLGVSSQEISASRLAHARIAAERSGCVVVLKGPDSIVARPDGLAVVNDVHAPALATGGTGDVLSGILATYLAKGLQPFEAAAAAVRAHTIAGAEAGARHGANHVIASDVIDALPHALS